ncbi:MAG TPA: hypothetical protein VFC78_24155 [Tepidisphaeraceae bacterium]|nr:hypothetical protein [Tepidisphaeraceae bacterium]
MLALGVSLSSPSNGHAAAAGLQTAARAAPADDIFDGKGDAPSPAPPAKPAEPKASAHSPDDATDATVPPADATQPPAQSAPAQAAPAAPARLPVPTRGVQAAALKTVHELFRADYARHAPADEAALAARLYAEATKDTGDPVGKYVLLHEACDRAADAGDAQLAMEAVDQLDASYVIDAKAMRLSALATAARAALTPAAARAATQAMLKLSQSALDAGDYTLAGKLATDAQVVARRARDMSLLSQARAAASDVTRLSHEYSAVKGAVAKLKANPDDPASNAAVGKYLALTREQWDRALPYLAKGSDVRLRSLAIEELSLSANASKPPSPVAAGKLAAAIFDAASRQEGSARMAMARHCRYWYAVAAAGQSGLAAIAAKRRLNELRAATVQPGLVTDIYDGTDFLMPFGTAIDGGAAILTKAVLRWRRVRGTIRDDGTGTTGQGRPGT